MIRNRAKLLWFMQRDQGKRKRECILRQLVVDSMLVECMYDMISWNLFFSNEFIKVKTKPRLKLVKIELTDNSNVHMIRSNSWLQKFTNWNKLIRYRINGESADADWKADER